MLKYMLNPVIRPQILVLLEKKKEFGTSKKHLAYTCSQTNIIIRKWGR